MAYGELKFGLDAETASRLDDLVMQLRALNQRIPPAWYRQVDEALNSLNRAAGLTEPVSEADSHNFTNTVNVAEAPKRGWVAVAKPTQVKVTIGGKTVGTFTISPTTGRVEIVSSVPGTRVSKAHWWPSLEVAVKWVMEQASWEDITNDEVFISWDTSAPSTEDSDEINEDDEDDV